MRRLIPIILLLVIGVTGAMARGVDSNQDPAPTLVPPTPVPFPQSAEQDILPSESAVARIQRNGVVRVGVLYNAPPFGELNIRGDLTGYDADVARSMATTWGVEVEFVQVTRDMDRAVRMLRAGTVDMLASALVHRRELDSILEFSQTYYLAGQHVMVRVDDPANAPAEMGGRTLGVVIGTSGEAAVADWSQRTGVPLNVQTFLTLDRAYSALAQGQIDGVVESRVRLQQVSIQQPDTIRILDEPLQIEPHAIAVLRQDVSMRNLVNRTLQYLTQTGRMDEIYQVYFPGSPYNLTPPWRNLGEDAPTPAQFSTEIGFPQRYIVPQIQTERVVRVAGIFGVTADSDAPESERRLDTFHRNLLNEMAARWGASVEFIPNSVGNAVDLVAGGQADIAVGVEADWARVDAVDFTAQYLLHGERLMVMVDGDINNFAGLGGRDVVTANNEATAATRAVEVASTVNASIEIIQVREQDLAFAILEPEQDGDAAFGDSLRLIPHVQANPGVLRLTTAEDRGSPSPWYSERFMSMAVPRNDIDFRLLVEYTLQELILDGTLQRLLEPLMLPEDLPRFEVWPGSSDYLGFSLATN